MKNRKKYLRYWVLAITVMISLGLTVMAIQPSEVETLATTSEVYIPSEISQPIEPVIILETSRYNRITNSIDLEILNEEKEKCSARMIEAKSIERAAKEVFEYPENHPVVVLAKTEWQIANEDFKYYENLIHQIEEEMEKQRWKKKAEEYPVATATWLKLKSQGYNDFVCAGIIGNMMAETGGQTLNIRAEIYDASGYYYGVCQWNGGYCAPVHGRDLDGQLDFLTETIQEEIDTFGYAYKRDFHFEDFLNLEDEQAAALAFAKTYERCASASYWNREQNATVAYNYFINE